MRRSSRPEREPQRRCSRDRVPPRGEDELSPQRLRAIEADIDRIIVCSTLPAAGNALIDGVVFGPEGGLDGGRVWLYWQGQKQRIQQPRAMTLADIDELGLERGPRIAMASVLEVETGAPRSTGWTRGDSNP